MCNQEGTTQESDQGTQFSPDQKTVHNAFDKFLEVFIQGRNSLIVDYKVDGNDYEFSEEDIKNCLIFLKNVETLNPKDKKVSLQKKLEDLSTKEQGKCRKNYILLWHCYWIMYLMNDTSKTFLNKDAFGLSGLKAKAVFIDKGKEIASTKQVYSKEPIRPFRYLLGLIRYIWVDKKELNEDQIACFIKVCNFLKK